MIFFFSLHIIQNGFLKSSLLSLKYEVRNSKFKNILMSPIIINCDEIHELVFKEHNEYDKKELKIDKCEFYDCFADNGGAILMKFCRFDLKTCQFSNCRAKNLGGSIYSLYSSNTDIISSSFDSCLSNYSCGGCNLYSALEITMSSNNFSQNIARKRSAHCGIHSCSNSMIKYCVYFNGYSDLLSAFSCDFGQNSIENCVFAHNRMNKALFFYGVADLAIHFCSFINNQNVSIYWMSSNSIIMTRCRFSKRIEQEIESFKMSTFHFQNIEYNSIVTYMFNGLEPSPIETALATDNLPTLSGTIAQKTIIIDDSIEKTPPLQTPRQSIIVYIKPQKKQQALETSLISIRIMFSSVVLLLIIILSIIFWKFRSRKYEKTIKIGLKHEYNDLEKLFND